jgi:hypothetical protein
VSFIDVLPSIKASICFDDEQILIMILLRVKPEESGSAGKLAVARRYERAEPFGPWAFAEG